MLRACCDPTVSLHPSRGRFPDISHIGRVTELRDDEPPGSCRILLQTRRLLATVCVSGHILYALEIDVPKVMSKSSKLLCRAVRSITHHRESSLRRILGLQNSSLHCVALFDRSRSNSRSSFRVPRPNIGQDYKIPLSYP